jgi:hypothetical protein
VEEHEEHEEHEESEEEELKRGNWDIKQIVFGPNNEWVRSSAMIARPTNDGQRLQV